MTQFRFFAGLFLVTGCTLMLQLAQTRLLSVVAWYYLAFFAISMAMFGLTAGAIRVYLRPAEFDAKYLAFNLSYYTSIFAVSVAACFAFQSTLALISPGHYLWLTGLWVWFELSVAIAVPFFFSGIVVSLALTRSPYPIGRVYGVDLIGAAVGCLGVLALLSLTDGPSTMLWIATIASLAAWLFAGAELGGEPPQVSTAARLFRRHGLITVALAVVAVFNGATDRGFKPLMVKDRIEGPAQYMYLDWNSFSRVSVFDVGVKSPPLWGPSPLLPKKNWGVALRHATIDGAAGTPAHEYDGDLEKLGFLRYDVTNLAYNLPGRPKVGIIGVGGGRDVQSAALFGRKDITGVELNPILVRLHLESPVLRDFARLTRLEGVKLHADEGRSWFARTDESFDIIEMSLIDTWAATGAGAFTLSENGLYTVEAWKVFLGKLRPGGVFTVSRWFSPDNVDESGRMISLAAAALMELGVEDPRQHIFMATQETIATLVLSVSGFTDADIAALEAASAEMQHTVRISPRQAVASATLDTILSARTPAELEQVTSQFELDLTPPTDDRPFFFNQLPLNNPIKAYAIARERARMPTKGGVVAGNLSATFTLFILFMLALILVVVTIVLPMRHAIKDVGQKLVTGGTLYFLLIGVGFMFVEIALLQRLSVFLGHPFYSLSVLLFSLILSTGIGSLLSDRIVLDSQKRFTVWALVAGLYMAALPFWTPGLFAVYDSASLAVRAGLSVLLIAPAGILMGYGFPTGMRIVSNTDRKPTPWFWGINGAAGVLASIVAVALSIAAGISFTMVVGALCYLALIPVTMRYMEVR